MTFAETVARARAANRTLLSEVESKAALAEAGVRVTAAALARSREEAADLAGAAGFPAALKVVSADVPHKSDVGGVRLGLASRADVLAAHDAIMAAVAAARPDAAIEGVAVQAMAPPGVEVIVGVTADAQFGPVVMFGLGGVMVEVMGDVAFRLAPLGAGDARDMIDEIKGRPALDGARGRPPADLDALAETLERVAAFAAAHPEVRELDLNPVIASPGGAVAADARIVLADA